MTPNTVLETTMAAKLTNIPTTPKTPRRSSSKRGKNVTITTPNQESLINRSKVSPMQTRGRLSEAYDEPASGREGWWRCSIRETPVPGSYDSADFIIMLQKRPHSYRFKSDGRKSDPQPQIGKGATLLPGAYQHQDFLQRFDKFNTTYGFKTTKRDAKDFLNFGQKDKDINVSPDAYKMEKVLTMSVEKTPSKHFMFRSQTSRFPTTHFIPKTGPAPGNYEYSSPAVSQGVTSSFKSRTPRFSSSHTKVPGPGSYVPTFQYPMPNTVSQMGRQHGLFFSSAFQV